MDHEDSSGLGVNDAGTSSKIDTSLTQRRSRRVRKGWVYFIQAGDKIKIGFSTRPLNRLRDLQTSNPGALEIIGTMQGTKAYEHRLHERFKRFRVRGEWFRSTAALTRLIDAYTPEGIARQEARIQIFGPPRIRKQADPAIIARLSGLRAQFGADTPNGHRLTSLIAQVKCLADPENDDHLAVVKRLIAKTTADLHSS